MTLPEFFYTAKMTLLRGGAGKLGHTKAIILDFCGTLWTLPPSFGTLVIRSERQILSALLKGICSKYSIFWFPLTPPKWTKILTLEITILGLKMMMKSGLEWIILKFHEPFQSCCCPVQKICPERLNWPGWLAGISEGALGISKYFFLNHFSL